MKKILLIDDRIKSAENLLLTIEAILVNAVKKNLDGAPNIEELEIGYFLVFDSAEDPKGRPQQGEEVLDLLKRRMNTYFATKSNKPGYVRIEYFFLPMPYEEDPNNNTENLIDELQKCLGDNPDPYCILLDMLLFDKKDEQFIRSLKEGQLKEERSRIVSHLIYRRFQDHCIAYSAYPPQTIVEKWCKIADSDVEPYELSVIANGKAIYIPFQQNLLAKLGIADGGRR